ncbi:MAG: hypothetical protein ACK46L_09155 [Synechococcaceae cyanobacterium]|jgi:hypothetical protein
MTLNQRLGPDIDRAGALQASGGLVLGLIALLTSVDHISLAGHNIPLQGPVGSLSPQPWLGRRAYGALRGTRC